MLSNDEARTRFGDARLLLLLLFDEVSGNARMGCSTKDTVRDTIDSNESNESMQRERESNRAFELGLFFRNFSHMLGERRGERTIRVRRAKKRVTGNG